MSVRDRLLAALVAVLWGLNFLAVRVGLDYIPPIFFAALRYLLLVVPVVLFVPRPKVAFRWLLGYGLGFGVAQFALVFFAIQHGMPTGLASLVEEASAPFTVVLGVLLLKEQLSRQQLIGILLAVLGIAVIAWDRAESAALWPVVLTLLGALGWALANLATRLADPPDPLQFSLWMSVIPPIPLLLLSAVFEGPGDGWRAVGRAFTGHGWQALVATAFIVLMGTVVGSTVWTALLSRHPVSAVAPFSLLVPVVGMGGAWIALHERPGALSLAGGAVVIAGIVVGLPRGSAPATTVTTPDAVPTAEPVRAD